MSNLDRVLEKSVKRIKKKKQRQKRITPEKPQREGQGSTQAPLKGITVYYSEVLEKEFVINQDRSVDIGHTEGPQGKEVFKPEVRYSRQEIDYILDLDLKREQLRALHRIKEAFSGTITKIHKGRLKEDDKGR